MNSNSSTTATHTPGPWAVRNSGHKQEFVAFVGSYVKVATNTSPVFRGIAAIENNERRGTSGAEDSANARLIAAAPELLEACEWTARNAAALFDASDNIADEQQRTMFRDALSNMFSRARAAIAKAEGTK